MNRRTSTFLKLLFSYRDKLNSLNDKQLLEESWWDRASTSLGLHTGFSNRKKFEDKDSKMDFKSKMARILLLEVVKDDIEKKTDTKGLLI